jgi:hypothetical protein
VVSYVCLGIDEMAVRLMMCRWRSACRNQTGRVLWGRKRMEMVMVILWSWGALCRVAGRGTWTRVVVFVCIHNVVHFRSLDEVGRVHNAVGNR